MTVQPLDPIICQHCQNRRHGDCAEPRCECTCSPTYRPVPPIPCEVPGTATPPRLEGGTA